MNLNPIVFALRHPITVMVAIAAVVVASGLAFFRMKVDIFPQLNLPVVYVAQPYGGMDPAQMEGLITNYYEYHFLYISGIHHVESRNIQGAALMKLFFHPDTNMSQALAETIGYVNRCAGLHAPGNRAPLRDAFRHGERARRLPGPFEQDAEHRRNSGPGPVQGASDVRQSSGRLSATALRRQGGPSSFARTPIGFARTTSRPRSSYIALTSGNLVSPSGNIRTPEQMPIVPVDSMVIDPKELGNIAVRPGADVYVRDLATVEDSSDVVTGYALVNGKRAVYILVTKRADASTLSVVNTVKANLANMQAAIPEDINVSFEFDQSPYVLRAIWGVGIEGLLGAALTGLMVLVFLRDWRSVIVVVLNIPFALLGSVVALWLTGQTINLMTLGGLGLAVGILVDEATVEVENIHTQLNTRPASHAPSVWETTKRPSPACWPCSAYSPYSFHRSSWKVRPAPCSFPCRSPLVSRWWPATSCRARLCRSSRFGSCVTITNRTRVTRADFRLCGCAMSTRSSCVR